MSQTCLFVAFEESALSWLQGVTRVGARACSALAITIPSHDLGDAMTKLKHVDGDTFVRLTDDGEHRETWLFELGDDGRTQRVRYHDGYWIRIE